MFNNCTNTKQQGDVGVAQAIAYYTTKGYIVSTPLTDNSPYDLVVDKGCTPFRVQIKTSSNIKPSGSYEVQLQTSGGNQSWNGLKKKINSDRVDLVFILLSNGKMYEFPINHLSGRSTVTLGEKYSEFCLNG